ncbi:MAG TPA: FAD-dependent oxidoreductase [Micropepsaceae bacterium]|jgi:monoamine oxidase|nr:FAD-dependent oxidoreductase [Micropepsaceae bacterium]
MDQSARHKPPLSPRPMHRRHFLNTALSAAAFAASPLSAQPATPLRRGPESVLVVGAGLAGLVAAYRLRDAGKRVILIEARTDPGGRVRTLRNYFADGIYGELGAARVAETHEYVLHWLNELNLSLTPFAPVSGAALQVVGAMAFRADDEAARSRIVPGLHADERRLSPSGLLLKYLQNVPDELANPETDISDPRWREFDSVSWPRWLASRGASPAAIQLMTLGGDSSGFSALFMLQQIMLHRDSRQYMKIEGGMDRLPRSIAARLKDVIHYSCELTRLEHSPTGVRATCKTATGTETFAADRAVLAIPFSTLRGIAVVPAFSPQKTKVINELSYYEATRFLLQTKTRFWEKAHLTGGARSDAPADIWDMSYGQKATSGLISLTTGNAAIEQKLKSLGVDGQRGFGLALAKQAFPTVDAEVQKSFVQRWAQDPYVRGAFTVFHPGQMGQWVPVIGRSEGRVAFAGEHTAPWNGWMEGAVWSGERAAQQILEQ